MLRKYIICFLFIIFSPTYAQYFEIDIGYNNSNGTFEKYTDDGFSLRATYSNNISDSKFFRWQGSFQYISFYSDTWGDELALGSGGDGPDIDVTNSENGYTAQGGVRFTPERGLFKKASIFKPYSTINLGVIYLQEKTVYSDPDDNWNNWTGWTSNGGEYNNNGFNLDDIEDYRFNFIYSIEFGSNFNFKKWKGYGIDLGVRYNMCPSIKKTEQYMPETDGQTEKLKYKLDAAYYTIYFGVTFNLTAINKNKQNTTKIEI